MTEQAVAKEWVGFSPRRVWIIAVNTLKHPDEILAALRALPEVEDVSIVAGPKDLMLRLRVRDHEHLRSCLFDKIWKLPGVNRTETRWLLRFRPERLSAASMRSAR